MSNFYYIGDCWLCRTEFEYSAEYIANHIFNVDGRLFCHSCIKIPKEELDLKIEEKILKEV